MDYGVVRVGLTPQVMILAGFNISLASRANVNSPYSVLSP